MSLSDIVGHKRCVGILKRALATGRLAHAYLFVGPDGVGKRTVAWEMAKAIQCETQGEDACEGCRACGKVRAAVHPDVVMVEPDGRQILVGQIRALQQQMMYRPLEGPKRVVIIDQAHDLNAQAANALLKILEEPPQGNLLVLVARSESSVLPTVVSRCQRLYFAPLETPDVQRFLREREGWEESRAAKVASQCHGSIGRAFQLRDLPVEQWMAEAAEVLAQAPKLRVWELLETARAWSGSRQEAFHRIEALRGIVRDQVTGSIRNDGSPEAHSPMHRRLEALLGIWEMAGEVLEALERNLNPQLLMEDLMVRMAGRLGGIEAGRRA